VISRFVGAVPNDIYSGWSLAGHGEGLGYGRLWRRRTVPRRTKTDLGFLTGVSSIAL
jgi:hypothetical protein